MRLGRKAGRAMDNVFVERLWRSVKYEEVYLKAYEPVGEARLGLGRYFGFYNRGAAAPGLWLPDAGGGVRGRGRSGHIDGGGNSGRPPAPSVPAALVR